MDIINKKYQIFISSTYTDLIKARGEAIKVILNYYQLPIGMEMFSADNEEQWSTIQSTIDNSDYYIIIVGHRYGSITNKGVSYTEKEFDYAKEKGIPILAFIRNENAATLPTERDTEPDKQILLKKFRTKVKNNAMCDFWENETDLGQKIAIALPKIWNKIPRVGWIRSDKAMSVETAHELTTLIKENRELRDELERIQAISSKEQPNINVLINGKTSLTLIHKTIRNKNYQLIDYESLDEDIKDQLSFNEIEEYNNILNERIDEIEDYLNLVNDYENKNENYEDVIFKITNIGHAKANDIYIDIQFPPEIVILEKSDLNKLVAPERPTLPQNPTEIVANKIRGIEKIVAEKFYGGGYAHLDLVTFKPKRNYWIDTDKNLLTIKLEKLLHTRTSVIKDNLIIAPLKKGNYDIRINVVCDEYSSPKIYTIPVDIN